MSDQNGKLPLELHGWRLAPTADAELGQMRKAESGRGDRPKAWQKSLLRASMRI
jgi:hypothetical protein